MNPELQTLVDRVELLERHHRGAGLVAWIALVIAAAALSTPLLRPASTPGGRASYSVVEANRLLVRDLDGRIAGGIESAPDGSVRLVLGGRSTASAHLVLPRGGSPQLTMRSADGRVRLGLDGSERPSVWLSSDGRSSPVALGVTPSGNGEVWIRDAQGRPRFHAP